MPVSVTDAPTAPVVGDTLVMLGVIVKVDPLLSTPLAWTTTFPVVAPVGTGITIEVALQVPPGAKVPLKETVLVPRVDPKLVPVIVTEVPNGPEEGLTLVMLGAWTTVKVTPLLASPPTVTTTGPVVAPAGTGAMMLVALQFDTVAIVPLKVTVLVPCEAPKLEPVIVMAVPTAPEVWLKLVMLGAVAPPPFAALNAASATPQLPDAANDPLAEAIPAPVCI